MKRKRTEEKKKQNQNRVPPESVKIRMTHNGKCFSLGNGARVCMCVYVHVLINQHHPSDKAKGL